MKTVKPILTLLILVLSLQTTFAQKNNKKSVYINNAVAYVATKVSLSADEANGVKEILNEFVKTKKELKSNTIINSQEKKAKNKEMYALRNKNLNKLLGKEKGTEVKNAIKEFQKMNNKD